MRRREDTVPAMSATQAERDIALQLYTLRDQLTASPETTFATIVDAGYTAIEFFRPVELLPTLGHLLEQSGLRVPSVHAQLVGQEPGPIFETASALGAKTVIDPRVDPSKWASRDDILRTADSLNELGESAKAWNLTIGYHNHDIELSSRIDGKPALTVLAEALSPAVALEVDVYWAAVGGVDVVSLLTELGERVRLLHIKDAPATESGTIDADRSKQVPFGSGSLDAAAVLAAAPHASTLVVEFDGFEGDLTAGITDARKRAETLVGAEAR